ncbi:acyl-CoA dehydrogenase family protein [Pseudonocardia pini]|uniref:acyl-CoA dehydrogenase family protein n=1 Tax=Pseudonocardia pini TaxID=2758030 RepID=UPI0015F05D67|nr:acyl-CoA dehydrogenase family protein [Pseudonocardia pini]
MPRAAVRSDLVDTDLAWCLTDEHRAWRKVLRDFAEEVLRPGVARRSIEAAVDLDVLGRLGELGVYGTLVPEELGGSGADLVSASLQIEELARVDSSASTTVHVQMANASLLAELGTPEQKDRLFPALATGESFLALGLTEPSGGSDAGNIGTRAVRADGGWVINGAKQFISNSGLPMTDHVLVVAATGGFGERRPETTAFLVPIGAPGLEVGPGYDKLGWRSADTHPLYLQDVRVTDADVVGPVGGGYGRILQYLTWARIPVAAMSVGVAQGCLEGAARFVTERTSFGKPLHQHQTVAFAMADLAALTHTARSVTYDAAWKRDHGHPFEQEAAICKLVASEIANKVAYSASELHGGYGFMDDYDVTRHYRDAKVLTIGEGTSAVQRMLIARSLGFPA